MNFSGFLITPARHCWGIEQDATVQLVTSHLFRILPLGFIDWWVLLTDDPQLVILGAPSQICQIVMSLPEYDFHLRIIGPYPADDKLMPLQRGGALVYQLPGRLLLVEGDEAEVLGGVVAQLVHGANHFNHRSKLEKHSSEWIGSQ